MNQPPLPPPQTTAAVSAAALAALTFHQVFPWHELIAPIALGALLPAAVSITMRRRPSWQPVIVSFVLWAIIVAPVVFHSAPSPHVGTETLRGLRDGWRTILTTVLPIPRHPELLVVAFTATWLTTAMTAELATRTRAAAAPVLPPIGLLVLADILGAGGQDSTSLLALIAAGTTVAALLAMSLRLQRPQRPRPQAALGTTGILAIAVAALAAAPHVPFIAGATAFDPKRSVSLPPPAIRLAVSPLDEANSWLTQPNRELFTVRATTAEPWRLAVFDAFDGAGWTSSARWTPTGGRIPPAQATAPGSTSLTQTITIGGLTGPWLPAAERPADVSGIDTTIDPASGVITADAVPHPGQTYTVRSTPAAPTAGQLLTANVAHDAEAQADLALPTVDSNGQTLDAYQALAAAATSATTGATTPYQQASMLEQFLRSNTRYDPTAAVGYSYRGLQDFVTTTKRGTTVQSAAAFVVMARTLGLPSRIAVGFQAGTRVGDVWHVSTGDVMAWPEVDFQGLGWTPFWPTPGTAASAPPAAAPPRGSSGDQSNDTTSSDTSPPPTSPPTSNQSGSGKNTDSSAKSKSESSTSLPLLPLAGAFAVAVYVITVPTMPGRRRRKRARQKDPAARIRGAWQQAVEQVADVELVRPEKRRLSTLTTAEFVMAAGPVLDPAAVPHLAELAVLMEATAYAGTAADTVEADRAWWHVTALERLARRQSGHWRHWARRAVGR